MRPPGSTGHTRRRPFAAHAIHALLTLLCAFPLQAAPPSNPSASATARATLDYLSALKSAAGAHLIVGQQIGFVSSAYASTVYFAPNGYDAYVVPLQQQTGKWLGLIDADFASPDASVSYPIDYSEVTAVLIDHWRRGGLVTVMYSARNPWTGRTANDRSVLMPMSDIVRPGTVANANWLQQLDSLAAGLKALRDAGVIVLFRPLHEINGSWFWWGHNPANPTIASDIVALWRYTHDYLSRHHGLDNLLWVYAATPAIGSSTIDELSFYPGDAYVDIVGADIYQRSFGNAELNAFAKLRTLGKPICLCEYGPSTQASDGSLDYLNMLTGEIKAKVPDIAYMMAWNDYPKGGGTARIALLSNRNAAAMLADPWVVTADEIASATHGSAPPTRAEIDRLFDYAERIAPAWFSPAGTATVDIAGYTARIYSGGYAIGVRNGRLYVAGPAFGGLTDLGDVGPWLARAASGG